MSTIKEVARAANVSVATVSRVINKDPAVRPSTRDHVLQAIRRLDYTPNLLGRNLRQVRTGKILVLIPSISNQFYSKVIRAMEKTAKTAGFCVLVCMTHNDPLIEREYIDMLTARVVDGILFFSSSLTKEEMDRLAGSYPVVQCCEYVDGSKTDTVIIDNEQAAYDAVHYLLDCGHRKVVFFGSRVKYTSGALREEGYRRAMEDFQTARGAAGLSAKGSAGPAVFLDDYSYPGGQRMAAECLKAGRKPDAIFCISDSMAIGAIREFTDRGIRVPEDISVFGFDDTSVAKVYCPAISTVAQPQADIGDAAVRMLTERIRDTGLPPRRVILPHRLIPRETTLARDGSDMSGS